MLLGFKVSNFLSFNDTIDLSMKAGRFRKFNQRIYKSKYGKYVKCKAIYGPNSSGKSNIVEAFNFMQSTVVRGLPMRCYQKYHRLVFTNIDKPSHFEIAIKFDGRNYLYYFDVLIYIGKICSEGLYEFFEYNDSKRVIFERNINKGVYSIGDYLKDRLDRNKLELYLSDSAEDCEHLFLNTLNRGRDKMYKDNPNLSVLQEIYSFIKYKIVVKKAEDMLNGTPWGLYANLDWLKNIVTSLGIRLTDIRKQELSQEAFKDIIPKEVFDELDKEIEENIRKSTLDRGEESVSFVLCSYKSIFEISVNIKSGQRKVETIKFVHENKDVLFDSSEESDGTIRLLKLLDILFNSDDDKAYIIDEIDRCLHPALTKKIFELFLEAAQTRNCQLIATTHEDFLLRKDFLRNDEICYLAKDVEGASRIYPVEDLELRSDKSLYAALMEEKGSKFLPEFSL